MGFPDKTLQSRALVVPGLYTVIPAEGVVINSVPGFHQVDVTIQASPRIGASFVQYLARFHNGETTTSFACESHEESFCYVNHGEVIAILEGKEHSLRSGSFLYSAPGAGVMLKSKGEAEMILYKQRFRPLEGQELPESIIGHIDDVEEFDYDGLPEVKMRNFLPTDLRYDMNFHTLEFQPGAGHPFLETHVQEHSMYILQGQGIYNLDNTWMPVEKGDYVWMGPWCIQGAYGVGRESMLYIYSKDCNRDEEV